MTGDARPCRETMVRFAGTRSSVLGNAGILPATSRRPAIVHAEPEARGSRKAVFVTPDLYMRQGGEPSHVGLGGGGFGGLAISWQYPGHESIRPDAGITTHLEAIRIPGR